MAVLGDLQPQRVFHYFEEICSIPHGSYHEQHISDYLVAFAKQHGFSYVQDDLYNVVILVPASKGYEEQEPVILQGHMDMVCEKTADCDIDFETQGLKIAHNEQFVYAKDTTLGGDDGIALAYMLAIAEESNINHPALELVITVSEEVGMEGASGIDLSMLKGHRMVNLDSEEEGIFLSSCAGGISTLSTLPVEYQLSELLDFYTLSVNGLLGGHSGCEIDKGRANANCLLGRVLYELKQLEVICIESMEGGKKDNAIPIAASAVIGVPKHAISLVEQTLKMVTADICAEYRMTDQNISIDMTCLAKDETRNVLTSESMNRVITLLMTLPNGVMEMSGSIEGLVETSLNLGIMKLTKEHLFLQHAVRSSVTSRKYYVANKIQCLFTQLGGTVEKKGDYPAWEYCEESVVRPRLIALYEKMYGKTPQVMGIHAGLECGILAQKIPNLDCVAMGPDILDIHTTEERLDIASTKRVYEFLLEYLKIKDDM